MKSKGPPGKDDEEQRWLASLGPELPNPRLDAFYECADDPVVGSRICTRCERTFKVTRAMSMTTIDRCIPCMIQGAAGRRR